MARPTKRSGTQNVQFQKRLPADVKKLLDGLPPHYRPNGWGKEFITISTGTADARKARTEFARIGAEVEERFARLRSGIRSLTHKETIALAGTVYEAWSTILEDNPGSTTRWDSVLVENIKARAGKYGRGPLLIGAAAQRKASMEERFGPIVDAVLVRECLIIDEASRRRLLDEVALALDRSAMKLRRNADGDYSPDEIASRYPSWQNPSATSKPKRKLGVADLFKRWASHPEQNQQAPRTVARYKGVFDAFDKFKHDADATSITVDDVRRFTDALMTESRMAPRTVRDVYKAAISSVYNWAVGKGITHINPAAGVTIKVKKALALRPSELTDMETSSLVAACTALVNVKAATPAAAQRWCPLICLYTGARIGEVTQVRREDFKQLGDVWFIRITPEAGTVKDREYRDVPIHHRLITLGLLVFIENAPAGPLFYNSSAPRRVVNAKTSQSELIASGVVEWARKMCLHDPMLKRPMHALRHRFTTVARKAGIDPQYIEAITGHAPKGQNSLYGSFDIVTLMREMEKLDPELVEGRLKR